MTDNKPLYDPEDIRFIREEVAPKMGDMEVEHILYLAAIIRQVDGSNSLGACKLAEAILSHHLIEEIKFKR
jgi:hypothetical protein